MIDFKQIGKNIKKNEVKQEKSILNASSHEYKQNNN